jgi:DNA-binding NarL/FixJ family response regulator
VEATRGEAPSNAADKGVGIAGITIRVLVVDDHPMVRDVIAMACRDRPSLDVVGEAGDGLEALELCRTLQPDVVVLDLGLPGLHGSDVIRLLRERGHPVRILVVSGRDDHAAIFESLRLGADAYLEKTRSVEHIAAAVEAVASGTQVFGMDQHRGALDALREIARRSRETARVSASLTAREGEVLDLIARGLTTRQMASHLGVSERTIETHVSHVYEKLEVRTRVQALQRATALRLIDLAGAWAQQRA